MEALFEKVLGDVGRFNGEFVLRVVARCYLEYGGHRLELDPRWGTGEHLDYRTAETPAGKTTHLYQIDNI